MNIPKTWEGGVDLLLIDGTEYSEVTIEGIEENILGECFVISDDFDEKLIYIPIRRVIAVIHKHESE